MQASSKTLRPMLGIAMFTAFSAIVLLVSSFAGAGDRVNFVASQNTVAPGDTVTVSATIDVGDLGINAALLGVTYDNTVLSFNEFIPDTTQMPWDGLTTGDTGTVEVAAFVPTADGVNADGIPVGTFSFTAISEGSADISVSPTSEFGYAEGGFDVPNVTPLTITVETASGDDGGTDGTPPTTGDDGGTDGTPPSSDDGTPTTGGGGGDDGAPPTNAAKRLDFSLETYEYGGSGTVDVAVELSTDEPLNSLLYTVIYDNTVLEFVDFTPQTDSLGVQALTTDDNGAIQIAGFNATAEGANGSSMAVGILQFAVRSGQQSTEISFSSDSEVGTVDGEFITPQLGTSNVQPASTGDDGTPPPTGDDGGNDGGTPPTGSDGGGDDGTPPASSDQVLILSPTNESATVGQTFELDLTASVTEAMNGIELTVEFDSSKLSYVGFTADASSVSMQQLSATGNSISLAGFNTSPNGTSGSTLRLGTLEFTAAVNGDAQVRITSGEFGGSNGQFYDASFRNSTVTVSPVPPSGGDTAAPTAPSNLRVTSSEYNRVSIRWDGSRDSSGIREYQIFRRTGTSGTFRLVGTIPAPQAGFSDRSVFSSTQYQYRVRAIDNSSNRNDSSFSNVITFTTPAKPPTPPAPQPSTTTTTTTGGSGTTGGSSTPPSTGTPVNTNAGSTGGSPNEDTPDITEDDVQAVEEPAEVFGSTGDGTPSPELEGKVTTGVTGYKQAEIEVTNTDVRKAFIQYGLFSAGLFNRTEEVTWDGEGSELVLEMPDLVPGTQYFYQVVALDEDGNEILSEVFELSTLGYTVVATITDESGAPVSFLETTLFSDPIQSTTDSNGQVTYLNVSPGEHTIDFTYEGERISQPITVEDTITTDDGSSPIAQSFSVVAVGVASAANDEGGSSLVAIIVGLIVLIAIAIIIYIFIRRRQQPYGTAPPVTSYNTGTNVVTPGPTSAGPPQNLNDVLNNGGQAQSAPGAVIDPNRR